MAILSVKKRSAWLVYLSVYLRNFNGDRKAFRFRPERCESG